MVDAEPRPWPAPLDPEALRRRQEAADAVLRARRRFAEDGRYEDPDAPVLLLDDEELLAGWDADIGQLLAEARAARSGEQPVPLPASLSTTAVLRLRADPQAYAAELARPMPRPPSRAARFGTRFHLWVERYFGAALATGSLGQQLLDRPGRPARPGGRSALRTSRSCAPCATPSRPGGSAERSRTPSRRRSACGLAGRLVRGRIDAVYEADAGPGGGFTVPGGRLEDETGETADPLQLAIYRLAWAEANRIAPEQVDAVFYYVRTDRLVRPEALAGRSELEDLLTRSDEMPTSLIR